MEKTTFHVNKMDCPSEEQLIRLKLGDISAIRQLQFDIPERKLFVFHDGEGERIEKALSDLQLESRLVETVTTTAKKVGDSGKNERTVLYSVLVINFLFFLVEMTTGLISKSMGLVADSLDMLADSIVYGLSLYAVGHAVSRKKKIAKISGYFQFTLAVIGFAEVIRRFLGFETVPIFQTMIVVSVFALIGNAACLFLLQKSKDTGVHMKASWIFTSNDVIVNLGVIVAGILVYVTSSNKPDLIIGTIVFIIVARGALKIYNLSK